MFGKDPVRFYPGAFVQMGRFGKNDTELRFQEVEEGNLIVLLRNGFFETSCILRVSKQISLHQSFKLTAQIFHRIGNAAIFIEDVVEGHKFSNK